ncbi:hypothetical protein EW662_21670 [Escherichia coli]|nr:hypothetical protein EW662_21670 [Escherichia coli]
MQTFQTAAVVGLIDNMSGPLKQLSNQAKQAAKQIELMKLDASGLNQYNRGPGEAAPFASPLHQGGVA